MSSFCTRGDVRGTGLGRGKVEHSQEGMSSPVDSRCACGREIRPACASIRPLMLLGVWGCGGAPRTWATLVTAWGIGPVDRKEVGLWKGSSQMARTSTVLQAQVETSLVIG